MSNDIIIYNAEDSSDKVELQVENGSALLSKAEITGLFPNRAYIEYRKYQKRILSKVEKAYLDSITKLGKRIGVKSE
ncbi:hypothetical protein ACI1T6_01175 [Lactococcus petauri]|uniref:hypothetical protein n=1 Tax=Lactococcus petauri TaxID=1940789 RepID=UPI0038521252